MFSNLTCCSFVILIQAEVLIELMRSTVNWTNAFFDTKERRGDKFGVTHPLIVLGVVSANATFPNDSAHTHIQDE